MKGVPLFQKNLFERVFIADSEEIFDFRRFKVQAVSQYVE